MQPANNFIVLNIREYLASEDKRLGEDKLVQLLSEFSCPLNPDVERQYIRSIAPQYQLEVKKYVSSSHDTTRTKQKKMITLPEKEYSSTYG